jgi:pSer/pThr/pTyr-binding forkhead associated (FHA) protein|tara:strand:+ start:1684 stop:3165 length:1482 start_codon:yes stop_codon:yes gene_type:complete
MLEFEIKQGDAVREVVLDKTEVVIGRRNEKREVELDLTPDDLVSRVHARAWVEEGIVMIVDLDSSGGTMLNGNVITAPVALKSNDEVIVGETHLKIRATHPPTRKKGTPKRGPRKDRSRRKRPRPKPIRQPGEEENVVAKAKRTVPRQKVTSADNAIYVEITMEGSTQTQSFDCEEILIGRKHPQTDINVDLSGDLQVSRTHARAWKTRGICWVEDLGSTHGTRVNGTSINGACVVRPDDQVQIGSIILRLWTDVEEKSEPAMNQQDAPETTAGGESAFSAMDSYPVYKEDSYRYHAPGERSQKDLEDIFLSRKSPMGRIRSTYERALTDPFLRSDDAATLLEVLPDLPGAFESKQDSNAMVQWLVNQLPDWLEGVERAALFVIDPAINRIKVLAHVPSLKPILSDILTHRSLERRAAFAWQQVSKKESVRRLSMNAGMYVPLVTGGKEVGILCVEDTAEDGEFSEGQLSALTLIGQHAAVHLQNRLWRESGS